MRREDRGDRLNGLVLANLMTVNRSTIECTRTLQRMVNHEELRVRNKNLTATSVEEDSSSIREQVCFAAEIGKLLDQTFSSIAFSPSLLRRPTCGLVVWVRTCASKFKSVNSRPADTFTLRK